jgi:hypothetical protein
MTTEAQALLHSFESLPEPDQREVAAEILRRSLALDMPPLSDQQLVDLAEDAFLWLDRNEADDG